MNVAQVFKPVNRPQSNTERGEAEVLREIGLYYEAPPKGAGPAPGIARVIFVTPEMAIKWLDRNVDNRSFSSTTTRRYKSLIDEGEWHWTNDAISFNEQGNLINGQHRLAAIHQSGKGAWLTVSIGHDPESFKAMDTARRRSAADALGILGFKNTKSLAAAAKIVHHWLVGDYSKATSGSVENHVLVQIAWDHPRLSGPPAGNDDCSVWFVGKFKSELAGLMPLSIAIACHYIYSHLDSTRADQFITQLATGIGLTNNKAPVYLLRERLLRDAQKPVGRMHAREQLGYVTKAFNGHIEGRKMSQLRYSPGAGETFPTPVVSPDEIKAAP